MSMSGSVLYRRASLRIFPRISEGVSLVLDPYPVLVRHIRRNHLGISRDPASVPTCTTLMNFRTLGCRTVASKTVSSSKFVATANFCVRCKLSPIRLRFPRHFSDPWRVCGVRLRHREWTTGLYQQNLPVANHCELDCSLYLAPCCKLPITLLTGMRQLLGERAWIWMLMTLLIYQTTMMRTAFIR